MKKLLILTALSLFLVGCDYEPPEYSYQECFDDEVEGFDQLVVRQLFLDELAKVSEAHPEYACQPSKMGSRGISGCSHDLYYSFTCELK